MRLFDLNVSMIRKRRFFHWRNYHSRPLCFKTLVILLMMMRGYRLNEYMQRYTRAIWKRLLTRNMW